MGLRVNGMDRQEPEEARLDNRYTGGLVDWWNGRLVNCWTGLNQ